MTEHTPGPWRWVKGRLYSGATVDDAGYPMPEITQESNYGTGEADKVIIAAAPAMLEALEAIVRDADACAAMPPEAWELADRAIAQARGEGKE